MEKRFDRKTILEGAAILAGAHILGSCGGEKLSQITLPLVDEAQSINDGATAYNQAVRGEQTQLYPPPSPPKTWQNGAFITKVLLPEGNRSFAYTLDDGPSPHNSELILRDCERLGIFVTVFPVAVNIIAWPDILRRFRDAGHEIGAHSYYHSPYSAAPLAEQMQPTREVIHRETGLWVVANRTPGLTRGGNDIILKTARDLGMYELHTSLNQSDYIIPRLNEYQIADELAPQIAPGTFSLNHDGGNLRPTGTGWSTIANVAISRGYNCARATEMINMGIPYPGNVSYSALSALEDTSSTFDDSEYIDFCNYDPEIELNARLKETDLKYPEKMRITEALLQIEESKKD
jgi:peptidoglycan/xylan/chitin deacetylase (PgdA/CDA1 family)